MRINFKAALCGTLIAIAPARSLAGVPVHLTGNTAADDTLQHDIIQTITYYGAAFSCPAPSEIRAHILNAAKVPATADYKVASPGASYEDWDATFCGTNHKFLVTFWPDPQGGSFLKIGYPYPNDAPPLASH